MTASEGAALPVNYLTAWQLLHVMGSLHEGETVLVHSAGGGVGIAAIQLAKRAGARVFGTASAGKHERLKALGCRRLHRLHRATTSNARCASSPTAAASSSCSTPSAVASFEKSYRCLAPTGRLGMFGLSAAATGKCRSLLRRPRPRSPHAAAALRARARCMDENKGVFGVNVGHLWDESDRVSRWMERAARALPRRRRPARRRRSTFPSSAPPRRTTASRTARTSARCCSSRMKRAEKAERIAKILDRLYPAAADPARHEDPFTLLVSVVLSAQCTDARVNEVTPALFARARDAGGDGAPPGRGDRAPDPQLRPRAEKART